MSLLFIDYRKNAETLFSQSCTLLGFINAKLEEKVRKGEISILKTVLGAANIQLYKSVIIMTENNETSTFIVSELSKTVPETSLTYLSAKSALSLFPEMKCLHEEYYHDRPRDFSIILPNLYISSMNHASDIKMFETFGITAIINLAPQLCQNYFEHLPEFAYFTIYEEDRRDTDLSQYFDIAYRFIERYSKTTGVLVHCAAGISRSSTIVISYVMKKLKIGFHEAFEFVQERHPNTDPNIGFIQQLQEYEKQIKEEKS